MGWRVTSTKIDKKDVVYGRPRLLTHDEIIAAALQLGLEGLTMKKLATHLNVGTATLYQYWDSRKKLVQAAALQALGSLDLPEDTGQHWSDYALEFARCISDSLAESPSLVVANHAGEYGYGVQFKLVERFLTAMAKRDIAPAMGIRMFNIIGTAAFGGAVEEIRNRDFEIHEESASEVADRQFARMDKKEFPLLSEVVDQFPGESRDRIREILVAAFRSLAAEMGEDADNICPN